MGEATGIFRPGETDLLLRATLDALHAGRLDEGHDARVWVDALDGALGGWAYFGPQVATSAWELFWIGVDPARHGQGIGDGLLRFVENHVMHAGGTELVIETSSLPALQRARRFYVDRGYVLGAIIADHFALGDDKLSFAKRMSAIR